MSNRKRNYKCEETLGMDILAREGLDVSQINKLVENGMSEQLRDWEDIRMDNKLAENEISEQSRNWEDINKDKSKDSSIKNNSILEGQTKGGFDRVANQKNEKKGLDSETKKSVNQQKLISEIDKEIVLQKLAESNKELFEMGYICENSNILRQKWENPNISTVKDEKIDETKRSNRISDEIIDNNKTEINKNTNKNDRKDVVKLEEITDINLRKSLEKEIEEQNKLIIEYMERQKSQKSSTKQVDLHRESLISLVEWIMDEDIMNLYKIESGIVGAINCINSHESVHYAKLEYFLNVIKEAKIRKGFI